VAAAVLLSVIGWGYLVVSWGGDEERATAAPEGARAVEQTKPPATQEETQAVPDEAAYAATPKEQRAPSSGEKETTPEVPAGVAPEPRGRSEEPAPEPGSPEPLGTGVPVEARAETEGERVRFAAAEFVSAAYGYSGEDPDAYNQGVGRTVVWPAFFDSAGAAEVTRYAEQVENSGTRSAARLTRFEAEETAPGNATGYAYFETGEGYDPRTGDLTGERIAYRQWMTLSRIGETWKVESAGEVEEV
jgi:hypothetical protein